MSQCMPAKSVRLYVYGAQRPSVFNLIRRFPYDYNNLLLIFNATFSAHLRASSAYIQSNKKTTLNQGI